MPAFWVLGIVALVAALVLNARVGILITIQGRAVAASVQIGVFRVQVYPRRPRPKRDGTGRKKEKKKKPAEPSPGPERRPSLARILEVVRSVRGPVLRALSRTARGIRLDPLELYIVFGGQEDPASAAQNCGYATAALWAAVPVLERFRAVPDPCIGFRADFDAPETAVTGRLGVTARVGTLLTAGTGAGIAILRALAALEKEDSERTREKQDSRAA